MKSIKILEKKKRILNLNFDIGYTYDIMRETITIILLIEVIKTEVSLVRQFR